MQPLSSIRLTISFFILSFLIQGSCKKPGLYFPGYKNEGGWVIGSETCKNNDDEYWLIDLTYYPDAPQYGDTVTLNLITYTNVIKTKQLDPRLKHVGMAVSLDFKSITTEKIETTGCTVSNPITYKLRELFIINQFEIR